MAQSFQTASPLAPPQLRRSRLWSELTSEDFAGREMARTVAVLPVAAIEQHGPHLPTGTDTFIMEGHLARVRALLEDASGDEAPPVVLLPTQAIGLSTEHVSFAGTLTLSPETAIRAWREIGYGITRAGCRKLVIVSSHGGNSPIMDVVSRALRLEAGLLVVLTSWARLGYPDGLFDADEIRHGIHGGEIETSLMLAFRPDLVRLDQASDFAPRTRTMEQEYGMLRADRPAGFAWLAQDLHASGAAGNAAAGTAEKGEAAAGHAAAAFVRLLGEVARFDLGEAAGKPKPGFF
ncbi:creatininase family protein [Chelatococcus reniformis]|uniref:Creatininase n=1 Tax=Chelatococcus reniformis TaxID=1494448 RepID=A0A916U7Q8_9HYPH|nr:creatininase family protein [Chelatococcus reniformis]GGC63700.1 creatininase [Chelatococcus reniformis]